LVLIALLVFAFNLFGQIQLYTIDEGLSNKDVNSLLQSKYGNLWVGTELGLNRFDGYGFKEIGTKQGLSNAKINCMLEDKEGNLWIGTADGLNIINQKTGKIGNYFNVAGKDVKYTNTEVYSIIQINKDQVLVSVGNGNLILFDSPTKFKKVYSIKEHHKAFNHKITSLAVTQKSDLLIGIDYGTCHLFTKEFKMATKFKCKIENTREIIPVLNEDFVLISDRCGGLLKVDVKTGEYIMDSLIDKINNIHKNVTAFYDAGESEYWVAYDNGDIISFNLQSGYYQCHNEYLEGIMQGAARTFLKDNNGLVWIATSYGLIKYTPIRKLFTHVFSETNTGGYKGKPSVRGMIVDSNNDLYFGGYAGLFKISSKDGKINRMLSNVYYPVRLENYSFYPYRLINDKNSIWLCSETKGVFKYNKTTDKLEFPLKDLADPVINFYSCIAMLDQGEDTLWLGTSNGLFVYSRNSNRLERFSTKENSFNIDNLDITDLVKSGSDELWIATTTSGVIRLNIKNRTTQRYSINNSAIQNNYINDLFCFTDTLMLAGTRGGGLTFINTYNNNTYTYTKKDGLADNSVAGIWTDKNRSLWISTFNGLSRYSFTNNTFENFYTSDGLNENDFNISSHLILPDGKILVGSINGINSFYSDSLTQASAKKPRIYFSSFFKYSGINSEENENALSSVLKTGLSLNHHDKFFSVSFMLDDFKNPLRNTFSYLLEGYEEGWNNLGNQNTIRFNKLPAGTYTLKIKGMTGDGFTSVNELVIPLVVTEAFYSSPWFYLLLFFVVVIIVIFLARYRVNQQLKLNRLRTKISSDLHDEVGGLLTRISVHSELMKQGITENNSQEIIEKIASTSRLATSTMSDVIWSFDARNDKMGNLIDRLREISDSILTPLNIETNFLIKSINEEKEIDSNIRQSLYLIFKEAINNIAKHSNAKSVNIHLENSGKDFVMVISDNGNKSPTNSVHSGQGLKNMRMRASAIEAEIEIKTELGYQIRVKRIKFC